MFLCRQRKEASGETSSAKETLISGLLTSKIEKTHSCCSNHGFQLSTSLLYLVMVVMLALANYRAIVWPL